MELALELIQKAKDERWIHLDLGRCGLTELPEQLFELTQLKSLQLCDQYGWLDIDTNKIETIESNNSGASNNLSMLPKGFSSLINLEKLLIGGSRRLQWKLDDCSALAQCHSLSSLVVQYTNIKLLAGIEGLEGLQYLDIASNKVESLEGILTLPHLKALDCGRNPIVNFPELTKLTRLSHLFVYGLNLEKIDILSPLLQLNFLDLSDNQFTDASPLSRLEKLQILTLDENQLTDVSHLSRLNQLEELNLRSNQLTDVSPLSGLAQLRELNLSKNQLADVSSLSGLDQLRALNLSSNQLSDIAPLSGLEHLRSLDLDENQLTDVSPLSTLTLLKKLYLSRNKLTNAAPLSILKHLETLVLWDNQLTDIAPLHTLNNLQKLDLDNNKIKDVSSLCALENLNSLELNDNQIMDVSPLGELGQLKTLHLGGNQLTDVSLLSALDQLTELKLDDNQLIDVSPLSTFTRLKYLGLSGNQITDLVPLLNLLRRTPSGAVCLSDIFPLNEKGVNIYNNPLPSIIYDLIGEDNNRLVNYLEQIEQAGENLENLYEAKLIVVGEPGAGKTSLAEKLLDPDYQLTKLDDKESTTGINILHWSFPIPDRPTQSFKANIWDFGGQHIQYMTHQFFLTPSAVYVLVASNDRKELQHFPYWFKITNLLGRDKRSNQYSPVTVLLNRRKVLDTNQPVFPINFDRKRYIDQYPDLEITDYSFDMGSSAAALKAFREQLQSKLLSLRHIGDPVPAQWLSIRSTLAERAKEVDYISWVEFQEVCFKEGMTNEQYQLIFSYRLHILGSILHFQDDHVLADRVILNPEWAVDAVYSVLKSPEMEDNRGYFKEEVLKRVWGRRYTETEQRHLLRMMSHDNFEICYEVKILMENKGVL